MKRKTDNVATFKIIVQGVILFEKLLWYQASRNNHVLLLTVSKKYRTSCSSLDLVRAEQQQKSPPQFLFLHFRDDKFISFLVSSCSYRDKRCIEETILRLWKAWSNSLVIVTVCDSTSYFTLHFSLKSSTSNWLQWAHIIQNLMV